jgi:hypothetical protein
MARKSAAALEIVPPKLAGLEEPDDLDESELALWRDVVESKPSNWFGPDSAPLLKEYVRAAAMCDTLALSIKATLHGDGSPRALLEMRDREAKRAASLATKLRLTQQSRYTPQSAATASKRAGGTRPWELPT